MKKIPIIINKALVEKVVSKIDVIYKQIKKNEVIILIICLKDLILEI